MGTLPIRKSDVARLLIGGRLWLLRRKLFISKDDGAPELNPGGMALRRPPWRSPHSISHYVTALGTLSYAIPYLAVMGGDPRRRLQPRINAAYARIKHR